MIKAVTTKKSKEGNNRRMRAEVTIDGTGGEILYQMLGILNALENECPELLLKAIQLHMMEDR